MRLLAFVNVFLAEAPLRLKELTLRPNANRNRHISQDNPSLAVLVTWFTVYLTLKFVISKRRYPLFIDDSIVL